LSKQIIKEAIKEIDEILSILSKESKWDIMANKISNLLLTEITDLQKKGINEFISFVASGEGKVTQKEVNKGLKKLGKLLGNSVAEKLSEPIQNFQTKAYKTGFEEVGSSLKFNQADQEALIWLSTDQNYWIGEHYNSQLKEKMLNSAKEIVDQSLDRKEAAKLFRDVFEENFRKSNNYWESLGDHIVTRSREFGRTSAYEKAEIEYIKIDAVLDERTSDICRHMDGRIISVKKLIKQRDDLMNAKTPEETKKIAPWLSKKEIETKVIGVETEKLPKGLAMPPYHFRCRTRTVIAYSDEV